MSRSLVLALAAMLALGAERLAVAAPQSGHHSGHQPAKEASPEQGEHPGHESGEEDPPKDDSEGTSHRHHSGMDHSEAPGAQTDHSQMDHSKMGHSEMQASAAQPDHTIERSPATASVEPYFVSPEMDRARVAARREMGGGRFSMLQGDRLEWRSGEGAAVGLLEGQGWYGGDMNRLWVKTDAEFLLDPISGAEDFESAEIQALLSRPISAYFDLQVGVRHDVEPSPARTFAVVGVQGLAPQWFEVDVAFFLSEYGHLSSRLEAEYEMLFTQRLMLQVRSELEVMGREVPELGLGSGLSSVEAGVRLSYGRAFAPYLGVSWEEKLGKTADFARAHGEEASSVSAVVGLRFWY